MEQRGISLTLGVAAVLMVLGIVRGTTAPPVPEDKPKTEVPAPPVAPAPVAATGKCTRWCEPLRLYQEFFALSADTAVAVPADAAAPACASGPLAPVAAAAKGLGYRLEVLVAMVPDPLDSGMAYRSDEALEAIQRGLARSGYLFDRQWFPWVGDAAKTRRYRREPGAFLFRGRDALMLVLLAGEMSKGGVHRTAFLESLDLAREVQCVAGTDGPLRILGPSFSGSTPSLRIAFRRWIDAEGTLTGPPAPNETQRIRLVTGSATAQGLEGVFAREFGGAVRLERSVPSDDELLQKSMWFLTHRLGWDPKAVALLSEIDTGYGQSLGAPDGAFLVQFPSHLAQLRIAREKKGLNNKKREPEPMIETGRPILDPSLTGEDPEPVEVVPQLSSLSTAGDDLALSRQIRSLCLEGARYVGILATDLRDQLFLAEQVRALCPDMVLFTFDNHLLDAHPQFSRTMEGALILTSFPLYVPAQEAERGMRSRSLSSSQFQEGILLAVQRLLREPAEVKPEEMPHSWVVAVGKGGLWPLASLDQNQEAKPRTIAGSETVALKWTAASLVIALLAVWLSFSVRPFQVAGARIWTSVGGGPGLRLLLTVGLGALTLASGLLLAFYTLSQQRGSWAAFFSQGGGLRVVNVATLVAVYVGLILWGEHLLRPALHLRLAVRRLLWLAGGFAVLWGLRLAIRGFWIFPEGEELFYARAGDFGSGLSPLVSLACLLAAVYAWALLELRRRRLVLLQEVSWPLSAAVADSEQPLATCGRQARQLDRFLWAWLPGPWFWGIVALALTLPARRLRFGLQPIAEPVAYGWVFLALVALCFVLGAMAFYRFFVTWRRLEGLLDLLCHTWVLAALRKSTSLIDWQPLRSFGLRMPRHKMSLVSAQELKVLARLGVLGADGAALTAPDGPLDRTLGGLFEVDLTRDVAGEIRLRKSLQGRLAASAHTLEESWRQLGGAEPRVPDAEGKLAPGPNEVQLRQIEAYLALRVAAWLRYVFAHLRYALLTAMVCALFVLAGVSAYAFQPKRYLSFGIWVALLIGSALSLRTFLRMERNAVLSAVGGTDAGKVSFDRTFFANLFTYAGIPLLGVILTQFPAVGSLLGDWFQPLLRLLTAS